MQGEFPDNRIVGAGKRMHGRSGNLKAHFTFSHVFRLVWVHQNLMVKPVVVRVGIFSRRYVAVSSPVRESLKF
jgi:hypothetical protein